MRADQTTQLQAMLGEWLSTRDPAARDRLILHAYGRLERLARKMRLVAYVPRRVADTEEVLQEALLALTKSFKDEDFMKRSFFEKDPPPTVRDFFRFASFKIRNVLCDLVRKQKNKRDRLVPLVLPPSHESEGGSARPADPADTTYNPFQLMKWAQFHEAVDRLSEQEREVFDLLWYQGLQQADAARVLEVDVRTIKRRWQKARLQLRGVLPNEPDNL